MSLPKQKFRPKRGCWKTEGNHVYWSETGERGNYEITRYEPTELEGIEREAQFKLVFLREIPDENTLSGKKKLWFAQDVSAKINDNVSKNIVLRFADKKWYISDLTMLGQTMVCPLESDSCVTVYKSEPYRINAETAKEIMKTNGWGFGKVEVTSSGQLEYYVTV